MSQCGLLGIGPSSHTAHPAPLPPALSLQVGVLRRRKYAEASHAACFVSQCVLLSPSSSSQTAHLAPLPSFLSLQVGVFRRGKYAGGKKVGKGNVANTGDTVKKGQTLGYVEQLGTFVEVKVCDAMGCCVLCGECCAVLSCGVM